MDGIDPPPPPHTHPRTHTHVPHYTLPTLQFPQGPCFYISGSELRHSRRHQSKRQKWQTAFCGLFFQSPTETKQCATGCGTTFRVTCVIIALVSDEIIQ